MVVFCHGRVNCGVETGVCHYDDFLLGSGCFSAIPCAVSNALFLWEYFWITSWVILTLFSDFSGVVKVLVCRTGVICSFCTS